VTENVQYQADRSRWKRGPWDREPEDRVDFVHAGFACFIKRGPMGAWCGYVGVPATHPAYGLHYEAVDVEVHGGLTYANKCVGAICHVPQPGMPDDVWWLGFDLNHFLDVAPGDPYRHEPSAAFPDLLARDGYLPGECYKPRGYAEAETRSLAEQLMEWTVKEEAQP